MTDNKDTVLIRDLPALWSEEWEIFISKAPAALLEDSTLLENIRLAHATGYMAGFGQAETAYIKLFGGAPRGVPLPTRQPDGDVNQADKYLDLQRQLLAGRASGPADDSEDEILDNMDGVWLAMSEADKQQVERHNEFRERDRNVTEAKTTDQLSKEEIIDIAAMLFNYQLLGPSVIIEMAEKLPWLVELAPKRWEMEAIIALARRGRTVARKDEQYYPDCVTFREKYSADPMGPE